MSRKKGYRQIADEIKAQIDAGALTQGQRLPTILQLAQEHHVAEMTVRRAIDILKRQKLISAITGQGIFVNRTGKKVLVLFHGAQPHPNDQSFLANGFTQKIRETLTGEGHQVEVAFKSKPRELGGPDVNTVYEKINEADLVLAFGIMDETYLQRMYALCGARPVRAGNPDPLQMSPRKPLVTVDYAPLMVDTTAVVVDSFAAGFHCAQSLIGTGCNRIAYLGQIRPEHPVGSPDNDSLLREAGVLKAVREAGLRPASEYIQHAKPAELADTIRRIMAAPNPPNGWVCYSLQEVTQLKTCAQENGQNPSKLRIASCAYAESFPQLREHASVQWRYFDQNEVLNAAVSAVVRLLEDPLSGNTRQTVKVLSQLPRRASLGRRRKPVFVPMADRSAKAASTQPAGS